MLYRRNFLAHCANNFARFKSNIKAVIEEILIVECWNLPTTIQETVDVLPAEFSEGKLDVNEENVCDENGEDVSGNKLCIKGNLRDVSWYWKHKG